MFHAHIAGTLASAPKEGRSRTGDRYVTVGVQVHVRNAEPMLFSVMAFDEAAADTLLTLSKGDPVSASGSTSLRTWQGRDGIERCGLAMTAERVFDGAPVPKQPRRRTQKPQTESDPFPAEAGDLSGVGR